MALAVLNNNLTSLDISVFANEARPRLKPRPD